MAKSDRTGSDTDIGRQDVERVKTRNPDGTQNSEYHRAYYRNNKERIALSNKKRYERVRSDPQTLILHRKQSLEHTHRWRAKNPERVIASRRRVYLSRKIRAMEMVGGAVCVNCGCNEIDYLEFNHKNGGGAKEFRDNLALKKYTGMVDQLLRGNRKPDDLEVLCRVCNALEFLERKNIMHKGRYTITWKPN